MSMVIDISIRNYNMLHMNNSSGPCTKILIIFHLQYLKYEQTGTSSICKDFHTQIDDLLNRIRVIISIYRS
jgi:hypothetical protein